MSIRVRRSRFLDVFRGAVLSACLLLPLLAAPSARAQEATDRPGKVELGIYGGVGIPDNYGGRETKVGPLLGGRAGFALTPRLGLEASAQRVWTKWTGRLHPATTVFDREAKHDAHLNALRLSALWRLDPARRLDPFLAVGAGLERTTIGDLNQNDLGLHAGAGIRWRFKAPLALRLDGRYVNVFLREPVKKHQDNVEFAIGLSFVPSAHAREAAVIPPPQPVTPPPAPPTPPPAPEPPPTPPAPPTPPPAPEKPTFQVTLLHFDTAKAKIRPDDLTRLQQAAEVLRADPNLRLAIEGHADSRGPEQYNQRLSERRANSALQWFLDQGFSKDRFEVRGFGELRPIADNKTRAGQQANRRVEIRAL